MYHSQSYLANWLHHNLRNILVINILLLVVLSDCVQCLDAEKDNSTSVSSTQVDDNHGDFGSDEEFTLDSVEQLPCSDLRGYAFHNQTKRCWKVGTKGPCNGPLMTFSSDPEHEGYGDCDCIPMKNCIGRPRSYHEGTDRCFFVYTRGPCPADQWLVFDKHRRPACEVNPCSAFKNQTRSSRNANEKPVGFMFPMDGKCYRTGTQAFCDEGETVYISSSDLKPRCFPVKPVCRFLIFTAQTLSCRPGSKLDVTGKCAMMRELEEDLH